MGEFAQALGPALQSGALSAGGGQEEEKSPWQTALEQDQRETDDFQRYLDLLMRARLMRGGLPGE